jgi:hypothetical protein
MGIRGEDFVLMRTTGEIVKPPTLRWPFVLILSILTLGIFEDVWLLWQSRWAKKVDPRSRATIFLAAGLLLFLVGWVFTEMADFKSLAGWVEIGGLVLSQIGNFSIKGTMEKHYNVSLSGVMTIFFTAIYFQYHFDRLAKNDSAGAMGNPAKRVNS